MCFAKTKIVLRFRSQKHVYQALEHMQFQELIELFCT